MAVSVHGSFCGQAHTHTTTTHTTLSYCQPVLHMWVAPAYWTTTNAQTHLHVVDLKQVRDILALSDNLPFFTANMLTNQNKIGQENTTD